MENRLPVLWTYGVETGKISRQKLVDLYATSPAKNTGIDHCKGRIAVGYDADMVIFDPAWRGIMSAQRSLHGVDFTPYEGMEQKGRPRQVLLRGEIIVDNGEYVGEGVPGRQVKGKPYGNSYR